LTKKYLFLSNYIVLLMSIYIFALVIKVLSILIVIQMKIITPEKNAELKKLILLRLSIASKYLEESEFKTEIRKALNEESEIPGFEDKPMKFGSFVNKDFAVMMTDIRKSTDIINSYNGTQKMFLIFYAYSALVAKIVDSYSGTATEFLGDGVLNLFDVSTGRDEALRNSIRAGREILEACSDILNPILIASSLPTINIGVGIDYGSAIVTRFGHKGDNDLKAFGQCVYNVSKLSKGVNEILVSSDAQRIWPLAINGALRFDPKLIDSKIAYRAYTI